MAGGMIAGCIYATNASTPGSSNAPFPLNYLLIDCSEAKLVNKKKDHLHKMISSRTVCCSNELLL